MPSSFRKLLYQFHLDHPTVVTYLPIATESPIQSFKWTGEMPSFRNCSLAPRISLTNSLKIPDTKCNVRHTQMTRENTRDLRGKPSSVTRTNERARLSINKILEALKGVNIFCTTITLVFEMDSAKFLKEQRAVYYF